MGLTERITDPRELRGWPGEIPVAQQYTIGPAGERFFREIKDKGRLMGARCSQCQVLYLPPRLYCEQCFSELIEWEEAPNRGRVHSFTVLHVDLDGNRLPEPELFAVVQIDGSHGGLIHRLRKVQPEDVYIGMPVETVFRKKQQRTGSILDIEYCRPVRA